MKAVVLIVDDEPAARYGMRKALEREGYVILEADSVSSAEDILGKNNPQAVILDVKLSSESGMDYLPALVSRPAAPSVVMVTAHGNERMAVEAIKKGAYDYLAKPFDVDELRLLVRNAVELYRLRQDNERLRQQLAGTDNLGEIIGSSPAMKKVFSLIEKVASTDATVHLTGESGTGKELVAREIHRRSQRPGSFVALNCAALPTELIESELFGHEKGAFTGAAARRIGKVESADKGTLFLDEVGDMSVATQAKLLRVLDEKRFQRLGSNETLSSDIRVISATNKNLRDEITHQRFREDLYYRLCVVSIQLTPLRDRKSDIPALAQAFCSRYTSAYKREPVLISSDTFKVLLAYDWPGNVRELRNVIERAVVLADGDEITQDQLPPELSQRRTTSATSDSGVVTVPLTLEFKDAKREFERLYVEKILEQTSGNITQAATALGMHRQSLQHKIKELGLTKRFTAKL
jgi:DNA-binding NtrC family response regulator